MIVEPNPLPAERMDELRDRVDAVLDRFLREARAEISGFSPAAVIPIDEVIRLIGAGGKRLRPVFCYWGYRASGASDPGPIVHAAAALELLHTMALIHDDVMDRSRERRGVSSSPVHLAGEALRLGIPDPDHAGLSLAILTGDLAAVLADRLFLGSGFDPGTLMPALDRYHRMRTQMASGQTLDVIGTREDPHALAALKGGAYTVEGPLLIGSALAGANPSVRSALSRYGRVLGLAFQLRDDERDGDGSPVVGEVAGLVEDAKAAIGGGEVDPIATAALIALADLVEAG